MNGIYWYNCVDKSKKHKGNLWMIAVVPRAGTWIEIRQPPAHPSNTGVVPRVGTWIEIHEQECFKQIGIVVSLTEIRIKILKLQWEK